MGSQGKGRDRERHGEGGGGEIVGGEDRRDTQRGRYRVIEGWREGERQGVRGVGLDAGSMQVKVMPLLS